MLTTLIILIVFFLSNFSVHKHYLQQNTLYPKGADFAEENSCVIYIYAT